MQECRGQPYEAMARENFFSSRSMLLTALLLLASAAPSLGKSSESKTKVDFNRDIRPIFSDHCYACHGPDEQKRKAGLRLDIEADAFKELKSGNHALVRDNPDKSALLGRITSTDPDEVM